MVIMVMAATVMGMVTAMEAIMKKNILQRTF